ncbi:methyl-accepting chemotaxis protein [Pseudodesulfovibrio sediminis]|uniref:Methyl-accepting chemotaxis protein n=1 Tax=Pseudodesulfovibrio sediminis TaxID=2810563 RepID=A0ABM7P8B3_9BACT|nr:methyl-accepting chemotaxis protein [Pseudodesulfovibrio sediminis]BCS89138.1 hypothetical protein PSDVSF_23800 [Pseudodesulfovibrio sediminis]
MGIKLKLLLLVGLPVAAMVIIFGVGLTSFYVIDSDMTEVNALHLDRATMIDADRDAYQAQVGVMEVFEAHSREELKTAKETSDENLKQAWDRIVGPSSNFSEDMMGTLEEFKKGYLKWKESNTSVISLSNETLGANILRGQAEAAALASFDSMRDIINNLGEIIDKRLQDPNLGQAERMRMERALSKVLNADRDAYQAYVAQLLITNATDVEVVNSLAESFTENVGQTKDRVIGGAELVGYAAEGLSKDFSIQFSAWEEQSKKVVDLTRANFDKNLERVSQLEKSKSAFGAMRDKIDKLGVMEMARVEANLVRLDEVISTTIWIYILVTVAFVIISILITLVVASRIANAMKESADVATALSEGDFSVRLNIDRNDEIGQLGTAISAMIAKLSEVVYKVQEASGNVASSSEELASSSESLSQGATEQASAVEEVSSAMEEISASISQNTDGSSRTEGIARKTAGESKEGGEAVRQTVNSMSQIAEKISIIEEIARQTNLLALNAAIEAARAGEHGKGFAVVAAEVRKLAEKSGLAANEISELSSESVDVATKAGKLLDSIVPNIEQTAELVQEITAASNEQNSGAVEINRALQQLDSVVQANAGSSEEIASTAEQMSAQAVELEKAMSFFRLGNSSASASQMIVKEAPRAIEGTSQGSGIPIEMDDSFERF